MREIKFRAWHKESKRFITERTAGMWTLRLYDDGSFTVYSSRQELVGDDDSVILSQYTGLHDKNGREFWEGDIVRISWTDYAGHYEEVVREVKWNGNGYGNVFDAGNSPKYTIEVVGNIYENPELVKEAK